MTVLNSYVRGYTAMPFSGTPRCGYMRYSHHSCPESDCPLNNSLVMVFAESPVKAHFACRRLWAATPEKTVLVQRLTVATETMTLNRRDIEVGIVDGDPRSWERFRNVHREFGKRVVRLPNIEALISFPNSPASIWQMHGEPMQLPWHGELHRSEDESWRELLDPGGNPLDPGGMIIEALEDDEGEDPGTLLGL